MQVYFPDQGQALIIKFRYQDDTTREEREIVSQVKSFALGRHIESYPEPLTIAASSAAAKGFEIDPKSYTDSDNLEISKPITGKTEISFVKYEDEDSKTFKEEAKKKNKIFNLSAGILVKNKGTILEVEFPNAVIREVNETVGDDKYPTEHIIFDSDTAICRLKNGNFKTMQLQGELQLGVFNHG